MVSAEGLTAAPLSDVARVTDPFFYTSDPFDAYARLRREAPVFWSEPGQLWAVSKYEDVKQVSRSPELFSSEYGLSPVYSIPLDDGADLGDTEMPRRAELRRRIERQFLGETDWILASDPPRHGVLRGLVRHAFAAKSVAQLQSEIAAITADTLDQIETGSVIDFVEAVASPIPIYVIANMLGVPREDWKDFRRWTDSLIEIRNVMEDPSAPNASRIGEDVMQLGMYLTASLKARRDKPRDDLMTALLNAEVDGDRLADAEWLAMVMLLLAAGNETTRSLLSGSCRLLAHHPDQRDLVIADPTLMPNAVEECLRLVTPIMSFCRTVMHPTVLRGQQLQRGDYLVMLYGSANRDEDIWARPGEFEVTRKPDPKHLAFGFGEHFCLGAALGRLEARIVLSALLDRFPRFELAGEAVIPPHAEVFSIASMPVVLQ